MSYGIVGPKDAANEVLPAPQSGAQGAELDSAESKVRRVDSFLGCDEFTYFFQKLKVCTTKSGKIIVIKKHKRDMKKNISKQRCCV